MWTQNLSKTYFCHISVNVSVRLLPSYFINHLSSELMYLHVLTAVLHDLNCLALCWPTQTKSVPSFSHVLLAHLRSLHLSIFPLGWLKASKRLNIWHWTLSLSIYPKSFQSERYLWKAVVLLGTCWWCGLMNAAKTPLFQLSSFFCWSADTHSHSL